jgi:hypothetical protein
MRSGPLEDALVLRALGEQLIAAARDRDVRRVAIAGDAPSLTIAAQTRWPTAVVVAWSGPAGPPADLLLALPPALLVHPLHDLTEAAAGAAHLMAWNGGGTHENAVLQAWRDTGTPPPPELERCVGALPPPPGWTVSRLIDVARFDSVTQLVTTLLDERGAVPPAPARDAIHERVAQLPAPHIAADGTLRVPVTVTLLSRPHVAG